MKNDLIWIKSKGKDYYRVLKKVQFLKIKVYEVKLNKDFLYLKIDRKDFEKVSKYLVTYDFKIVRNTGLKLIIDKIKKEKIFTLALIIGLGLFFIVKNLIVEVNIIHENKEIRELIKTELEEYKIKALSFKKKYSELDKIRQEILDKYPDKLDWMEFEVVGMVINVRVEERIITNITHENKICNLVAIKDGVVNDIIVLDGEVNVLINDYVRKGDVLVKGIINYNEEDKRKTCAKGEVYATVWYTASVSIPYEYENYQETKEKRYNLVWETNDNKHEILRSRFKNHHSYYKNILSIFDFKLYLETEVNVLKEKGKYSEEEALEQGIEKAIETIQKKLGKNDTIIDKKVLKKVANDSTMDIDVFIVVKELISTEVEIKDIEGND